MILPTEIWQKSNEVFCEYHLDFVSPFDNEVNMLELKQSVFSRQSQVQFGAVQP